MLFSSKDKLLTSILFLVYSNFPLLGIYTYALSQSVNSRINSLMLFSRKALIQKRKSFLYDKILLWRIPLYALKQKVNSYILAYMLFSRKDKFWSTILFHSHFNSLFYQEITLMLFISVSIPELSPLCFSAEKQ